MEGSSSSGSDPAFKSSQTIHTEHLKTVRAVAWSPAGKTLATASFDSNVGIWEQERDDDADEDGGEDGEAGLGNGEWECIGTLEGHETECKSVAYSASGTLLASCSRDKSVWIWEVQPDAEFECMGVLLEHSQDVKCVAWHPQEEILASGSYDDTIKLYVDDPSDDWYCFTTLKGHDSTVWSLAWSPCGRYLASASDDKTLRIWAYADISATAAENAGEKNNKVLQVKPPSALTSGQGDGRWVQVSVVEDAERSLYSVSWGKGKSGGLGWVASVGGDGTLRVYDIQEDPSSVALKPKLIASIPDAHGVYDVNGVSWNPRQGFEDVLATVGDDGSVKIWRVDSEKR
ncbi:WD40 repeat-like protein [Coprinellus micaceus]|uniref:Probable cytosolic iron-sulfur protein assembly protein 1 n=1 Tax=Coprinellus micaceus TaxID=71717 RepID=A0A4Y7SSC6_COPMI|nr:WD40 repeat-like protein [Coprinellus micaceus]